MKHGIGGFFATKESNSARSTTEVAENLEMAAFPTPHDLWAELREMGLIPDGAPTPASP